MRLAGQAKGGYYPCPHEAIDLVVKAIKPPAAGKFHILDPCAGKGLALAHLARELGGIPYGIELDAGRAVDLAQVVPNHLAPADIYGVRMSLEGFQVIWLNPPYDNELGGGGGRVEYSFLGHAYPWLVVGGLLCLVVPEKIVGCYGPTHTFLLERFDNVRVLPFPSDCRHYNEVVVLGTKRKRGRELDRDEKHEALLPWTRDRPTYRVPTGETPRVFEKAMLTELEIDESLAKSPLRRRLGPPAPLRLGRPPLPLYKGHQAVLLSAGHLDGIVRPEGEPPHVIRGVCSKEEYLKETKEEEKEDGAIISRQVFAEKFVLSIRALMPSGEIVTIK